MTDPTSIDLSVTGILNGDYFAAHGTLTVDSPGGTKYGDVTYDPYPGGVGPGPDCTLVQTTRCFVGARPVGRERFVGPLELLGREFISLRVTTVGRSGTVSLGERTRFVRGTLFTVLTAVGEFRVPKIRGVGPLREVLTVSDHETIVSRGRYSLLAKRGPPVPVHYTQFYRSLRPNRQLFRRLRGREYLLKADISVKAHRRSITYQSWSTVSRLKTSSRSRRTRAGTSRRRTV